jgi:hypothetical protein
LVWCDHGALKDLFQPLSKSTKLIKDKEMEPIKRLNCIMNVEICPSVRPFVHTSVRPFVHPSVHPSVCPSVYLFVCPSIHPLVRSSFCQCASLSDCQSVHNLSIYVSAHPSVCPSLYPSRLSICPSFCLSVCPSVHPSVWLSAICLWERCLSEYSVQYNRLGTIVNTGTECCNR